MSIKIIDLDNCISNDGWRRPRIKWHEDDMVKRYEEYHKHCHFDELCNRDIIQGDDDIVVFTSRPATHLDLTKCWLDRNAVHYLGIYMRPNGDFSSSVELKNDMLRKMYQYFDLKLADISIAYDDRPDVVNMYRKAGIEAEIRAINDYSVLDELSKKQQLEVK